MECNVLLMGLTGVGKSSLINYLAGKDLAEAGITTSAGGLTRGIHKYYIDINGQTCSVFDTEGLETTDEHSSFWQNLMDKELLNTSPDRPLDEWYHIVVYCIGANGGRVQDIELTMIDKLLNAGYGVIVAFTKADLAIEEDLQSLEEAVCNHFDTNSLQFIPICSKKTRNNQLEGKEELSTAIIESWGQSLINRLPHTVYDPVFDNLFDWYDEVFEWINQQKFGFFDRSKNDVLEDVNKKIAEKTTELNQKIKERQEECFDEVRDVYETLNLVIDTEALVANNPEFNSQLQKLESAFVFSSTTGSTMMKTGAFILGMTVFPVFTIAATVFAKLSGIFDNSEQIKNELKAGFNNQFFQIVRRFSEQERIFELSLAEMQYYVYSWVELGICYLKGWGVEKDVDKAIEYFNKVIDYKNENDYENPRFSWYMAYLLSETDLSRQSEITDYLKEAAELDSPYAKRVLAGEGINNVEAGRDSERDKLWEDLWSPEEE